MVEELEIRSLMTTSGGLTLNDGARSIADLGPTYLSHPATILAVDYFDGTDTNYNPPISIGGPQAFVSLTQGSHGLVVYTHHDAAFFYTPSPGILGLDTFTITETDGIDTATATESVLVVYTYQDYVLDVNHADEIYSAFVLQAADIRLAQINSARAGATSAADSAYGVYTATVAAAQTAYDKAFADAVTAYNKAATDADTAATTAYTTAETTYTTALTTAQTAYTTASTNDATANQAALDAAVAAYTASVAPYQAARDSAYAYSQDNPDDAAAAQAFNVADAALTAAIQTASDAQTAAQTDAGTTYQAALTADTQTLAAANATALTTLQTSAAAAVTVWNTSEQTATDTFHTTKNALDPVLIQAESDAWNTYGTALDNINTNLASAEAAIQSQYDAAVANALSLWQTSEQLDWNFYLTSLANFSPVPDPEARIMEPDPVWVADIPPFPALTPQPRLDVNAQDFDATHAGPPPDAMDDSYLAGANGYLSVPAPTGVLNNDDNPANFTLSAELVQGIDPSVGTLDLSADGSFTFTAGPNFQSEADFTYRLLVQVGDVIGPGTSAVVRIISSAFIAGISDLYSVAFKTNMTIVADDGSPNDPGPQWVVPGGGGALQITGHQYPISFTRDTKIELTPVFNVAATTLPFWQSCGTHILVRADAVPTNSCGLFQLGYSQTVNLQLAGTTLTTQGLVAMDNSLPDATAYYELCYVIAKNITIGKIDSCLISLA